ncbi:MAG: hypothetical protein KIS92_21850, partial [Planctomycetota bacterium]|nr:hypothetical protein [Planctomycetota bacterium]
MPVGFFPVLLFSTVALGALVGASLAWPPRLGHARRTLPPGLTLILFAALAALLLCAMNDRDWATPAAAFCAGIAFGYLLRADPSRDRAREAGILRELAEGVRLKMPLQPHVEAMMKEYRGELVLRL